MTEEEYQQENNRLKQRRFRLRARARREGLPDDYYITPDDFITRDVIGPALAQETPIDETDQESDQENLPEQASEQDESARPFIDESEQGYEEDTASIDEDEYPFDDDSEQDNSEQPPVLPWWVGVSFLAVGLLVYLWLAQYQG